MFELRVNVIRDIREGDAVRCEFLASGKLLVKNTRGDLLRITEPLANEVIRSHYLSHKRPLYGVVIDASGDDCLLHLVAPEKIKPEFQKIKEADIIPFPVDRSKEAA